MLYRYKNTGTTRSPWTAYSPEIRLGTTVAPVPFFIEKVHLLTVVGVRARKDARQQLELS